MPWLEDLKFPRGYQMGTHNEKYSLYYMKELMKTWVMKGYSAEDVENGKR